MCTYLITHVYTVCIVYVFQYIICMYNLMFFQITYAALQFSEVAGGGGKNDIHCTKELDNVQYSEVVRLQV